MDNHEEEKETLIAPSALTDGLAPPPSTGLGTRLLEARRRYIEAGGKLYTLEEINDEINAGRG